MNLLVPSLRYKHVLLYFLIGWFVSSSVGTAKPSPSLLPPGDLEFVKGEDFELRCQVKVPKSTYVSMNWTYKSNEVWSKRKEGLISWCYLFYCLQDVDMKYFLYINQNYFWGLNLDFFYCNHAYMIAKCHICYNIAILKLNCQFTGRYWWLLEYECNKIIIVLKGL